MQLEIALSDDLDGLSTLTEYLKGQDGCGKVADTKTNQQTMSVHDGVSFVLQNPDAMAAIGAGLGALLARLGNRVRLMIKKDGTLVGENLTPEAAQAIVEAFTRKKKK